MRSEAERLVGCKMTSTEGEQELLKFWPQVQAFKRTHFASPENGRQLATLNGMGMQPGVDFGVTLVKGVEEEVTSPELGLKGNLDVLVEAITRPVNSGSTANTASLMSIELKTHHKANPQPRHFGQLAYYSAMLLSRHGHTASEVITKNPQARDAIAASMLLYINNDVVNPIYVSPSLTDIKSLIDQRNRYISQAMQASRPRGVELVYDENEVVIRSWPAIHSGDGSVSYSLEWNGYKFVFGGDTFPNKWFIEYAKNADLAIHECFHLPDQMVKFYNQAPPVALYVATKIHTSPQAFGKIMSTIKPKHAVAYHFFNEEETRYGIYAGVRETYDGPLSMATDLMTWNITRDGIEERMATVTEALRRQN